MRDKIKHAGMNKYINKRKKRNDKRKTNLERAEDQTRRRIKSYLFSTLHRETIIKKENSFKTVNM